MLAQGLLWPSNPGGPEPSIRRERTRQTQLRRLASDAKVVEINPSLSVPRLRFIFPLTPHRFPPSLSLSISLSLSLKTRSFVVCSRISPVFSLLYPSILITETHTLDEGKDMLMEKPMIREIEQQL